LRTVTAVEPRGEVLSTRKDEPPHPSHTFGYEGIGLGSSFAHLEILDLVPSRDKLVVEVARLGLDASARFVIYEQRTTLEQRSFLG
jgi:hypothetical protein